jgi:membrane protein DedA with SNARE-associated domain
MTPIDTLQALERYAVVILPALVIAEQIGIPLPAVPALLAVGALAAHGRVSVPVILASIAVVAVVVDQGWYELGRRRGLAALASLCRLTLEPDTCVRRAETIFERHGARGLLVAKFVPGLTTVLPPLAGVFAVDRRRFVLYDLAGVLLWAGTWIALGYLFSDAIVAITEWAARLGRLLALVVVAALAGYVGLKYLRRRLFVRRLRMARVSPETLKQRLDAGEDVTIVDLRTPLEVAATPYAIPGSRWLSADAIDAHEAELLGARDLVLYCT